MGSTSERSAASRPPAISVVIPTYNRAHMIERAIRSVLRQTFEDFELVVADDASTDDTQAVVEAFEDARVRYVPRAENGGNAAARNTGVRASRAPLVAFLDSDDEYRPTFLKETHRVLTEAPISVGFSWCGRVVMRPAPGGGEGEVVDRRVVWAPQIEGDRQLSFLTTRRTGTDCGLAVRRHCFETVGFFDERLRASVDSDFLIRLVGAFDFTVVEEKLVVNHDHDGTRVRRDSSAAAEAYEVIFNKHAALLRRHPRVAASFLYKTGWLHHHAGEWARGNAYLWRALQYDPTNAKVWMALLLFGVGGTAAAPLHERLSGVRKTLRAVFS